MSASDKKDVLPCLWYRHTGQPEVDDIPGLPPTKSLDEGAIARDVGEYHITHLYINNGVIPSLEVIAPKLTHLRLKGITDPSQLHRLNSLNQLKALSLSDNDFSNGLPAVTLQLTSLELLSLRGCQLSDLPQSINSLNQLKVLYLSRNDFSNGLPAAKVQLTSLETLVLNRCKLSDLPQSLNCLNQLKKLNLSENDFSNGLPAAIAQLTSLETLTLFDCNLTDLPQSLNSLNQLKVLDLSYNDFSNGLPAAIGQLTSLETLWLRVCKLTDLPQRFGCETRLEYLNLSWNNFECLPPAFHYFSNLRVLDLKYNQKLQRIDEEVSQLQKLEELESEGCESLQTPPYAVCKQGLEAVKKYLADLKVEKGTELLLVPVAVVGMKSSGKSSLIKSLQAGERKLTFRDENSPLDETTKVFAIEELELKDFRVKLVDYGGHEIYHLAYQLVIKERCIPLIVVNIEEFHKLSQSEGVEEATRKLCISWCSHLYLAGPRLGPPLLILTHTDKLAVDEVKQCKEQLLTTSEDIRSEIVNEIQQYLGESLRSADKMVHFSNENMKLFDPVDVFEFNNDLTERSNIENLKVSLENHCKRFKVEIPRLWEKVEEFVNEQDTKSYIPLSEVTNKFSSNDPHIILRYMHNVGKILWFEEVEELKSYIFHDMPAITEMISLLLHHSSDEQWKQRVAKFRAFKCDQEVIGKKQYKSFVEQFTTTGVISCILLEHLLTTGSKFPIKIAIDLLKGFFILHGPIEEQGQRDKAYILPYFASTSLDDSWLTDGPIPLRVDMLFGGLSPPQYVYQLMTVIVLNHTASRLTNVSIRQNGVSILHDDCATHLVHDYFNRKVTFQVSSAVANLVKSWSHLIQVVKSLLNMLSRVWKACYTEVMVYCAQCLISSHPDPAYEVNPPWLSPAEVRYDIGGISTVTAISALGKVACPRCDSDSRGQRPAVPKPLRYPCQQLSNEEIETLEYHISAVQRSHPPQRPDTLPPVTTVAQQPYGEQEVGSFHGGEDTDFSPTSSALHQTVVEPEVSDLEDKRKMKLEQTEMTNLSINQVDSLQKLQADLGLLPVPPATTMSSETHDKLKKLISELKDSTAKDDTATPDVEANLFIDLAFVYNSDDGKATQEVLGVVIERYTDLTQHAQFIQFKRLTAVYERDMYNKFFVPIWAVAMNADKSVGYVLSPKLTPLREVLKDLKESYQTSDVYYDKLNQVLRLCFAPIALAIDALHTPIYNKRMMYHHRDICIDNIYMRVRKSIDSSGHGTVEYDDARLKLTGLTREVLPEDGGKQPTLGKYYHHADVSYDGKLYGREDDWYSFGVYILEVLHLALPITIQQAFRQIQDYADVSHVASWILASTDVDVIRPFLSQYLDIAVKCLKLQPNEHQPLGYEMPDEMKQRFLENSQTFQMYFEYSVSMWTAQLLWMYEELRPEETPDDSEDEVCQACLLRSTERISTKQHGRGNQPKCDEDCQYHCLVCYTSEERLFCSKQHGTTGTIVDHRYSHALILYGQLFEHVCKNDTESAGINPFKEEADMLAKALNSKLICGVPKANIHVRPVYGDGMPEDCLKRHCEVMRELIHGDGNSSCSNDTSYTLFTFYFGHSYHGCDKTVGDWCPSFTHTSDDAFEPLRLNRALVHYHMTSIQKCTNYGTSQPECQAACLCLNYLVNPCGPSPGSTAHQWSADKDVSISERSHPLVESTAGPCDVTVWFCQMLQGLYHSQCSGKPHVEDIQKQENYHHKCKVPLGKIDACFKLARYIYEELGEAFIDGECLRIHQKHLKAHNGYAELMVQIDDEYHKPVLAYYKPQGAFWKVFSANEGEEPVNIDFSGDITCDQIKEVVLNQIKDREKYKDKTLGIVLKSSNLIEHPRVSDDNINNIVESSALFYHVFPRIIRTGSRE